MQDYHSLAPLMPDDPAHYLVQDPQQLEYLLGQLAKHPEIVCLYPSQRHDSFALSTLLSVADDHLVFDASPDAHTQAMLLASSLMLCVSNLSRVRLQFEAGQPQAIQYENRPAIRTQRPNQLYYMQRRDFYRLPIPAHQPVYCQLSQDTGPVIEADVADISLGGISLIGPIPSLDLRPGMYLDGCRLELPNTDIIRVGLIVCATRDLGLRAGRHSLRIGCRFAQLPGDVQTQIQRYLNRQERARIAFS